MFIAIVLYGVLNSYEPQIDRQYDFFELMFPISEFVAGGFGLVIAKKYWGSKVFGKAYLSLGIGLIFAGIGTTLFGVFEVIYGIDNPFPNWNDIFNISYFLLVLYHLRSCVGYFQKKLSTKNKLLLILLPLTTTSILFVAILIPVSISGSVPELLSQQIQVGDTMFKLVPVSSPSEQYQHIIVSDVTYELVPVNLTTTKYEQTPMTDSPINIVPIAFSNFVVNPLMTNESPIFWIGIGLEIYFFAITTLNLSYAIVGAQVFRHTILGNAWGLLLLGIALTAIGDIIYYFSAIYTYDRTYPDIAFWVFGYMIISYALYLHRKSL